MESQWNGLFDGTFGMKINSKKNQNKRISRTCYELLYFPIYRQFFNLKNTVYRKFNIKNLEEHTCSFQKHF